MSANSTGVVQGPMVSLNEETAGQLNDKKHYLVELGTAEDSVKILATVGNEIGTAQDKLDPDSEVIGVRLLGSPGTTRFVAGGVIAKGGTFKAAAGGKVVAATTGRLLGRSLKQGNTADGEVFVAIPLVENKA